MSGVNVSDGINQLILDLNCQHVNDANGFLLSNLAGEKIFVLYFKTRLNCLRVDLPLETLIWLDLFVYYCLRAESVTTQITYRGHSSHFVSSIFTPVMLQTRKTVKLL